MQEHVPSLCVRVYRQAFIREKGKRGSLTMREGVSGLLFIDTV